MAAGDHPGGDLRELSARQAEDARELRELVRDTLVLIAESRTLIARPLWTEMEMIGPEDDDPPPAKSLSELAVDTLRQALEGASGTERWVLLDEALRLHRLARAQDIDSSDSRPAQAAALPPKDMEPATPRVTR